MTKVSDYIAQSLADHGVRHVFMLTGGGAMHLNDSLGRKDDLQCVFNLHEQASAIGAEGYFRASGRLAAVNVTSGPGGTNALTGVIGQWLDSVPCLYLSGQVKQATTIAACPDLRLRQLGDQEINIVDIVRPVTKYAMMVCDSDTIRYHLDKAIYLATHGRYGPVWLDIPLDVQSANVSEPNLVPYDSEEDAVRFDMGRMREQVTQLLDRIRSASRPVLLAGHGIRLAGAAELFIELVERLNIPVLTVDCGHDLIWSDHPLFYGRPGVNGDRLGNFVIQNSDLMLAIRARLSIPQIGYNYETFARAAFRAMVDIDENELHKPTLRLHIGVHADARLFIEEMLHQLGAERLSSTPEWMAWCEDRRRTLPSILDDNPSNPRYVNSYAFVDVLFRLLQPESIVVTGNGTSCRVTFQAMFIKKGIRVFSNRGCSSMGYDLPAAIGACFAREKQPVVLVTGDGSIQMNIQELQTIKFHRLPIKIFVLSNRGYLAIRTTQDTYFAGRHIGSEPEGGLSLPDICRVAEAYGLPTARLTTEDELSEKVADILSTPGPCVCEVLMDPKEALYPRVSSTMDSDGRMVSKPLEDMFPLLPRDEFLRNMIIPPLEY